MTRREWLRYVSLFALAGCVATRASADEVLVLDGLKQGYAKRLKQILAKGELPYIDIESSCNADKLDVESLVEQMDELNIGLMALSADISKGQYEKGVRVLALSQRLLARYPDHFIAVGNGGQPPLLTEAPDAFLDGQQSLAEQHQIQLFGEYEFRHYPSPRQVKRGELDRDVDVAIDGAVGHRLFAMSERTGLAFQIHYEIEDALLPKLEAMLAQYPKAKVIWCHLAQVRYIERAGQYSAAYVDGLLQRFPNLYIDTAFGDVSSIYPLSQQHHARIWDTDGSVLPVWRDLIVKHSTRFLSALDLGGDRMNQIAQYDQKHRVFLNQLPDIVRHRVAYQNAWQLLFGEAFA